MIFNYAEIQKLPEDVSIIILLKFISKLKNARLRPGKLNSDCPPIFFWWFEENNEEAIKLIKKAFDSYKWETPWTLEEKENNKWLLFPERIRNAEMIVKGTSNKNIEVTDDGVIWLMENDPAFGRQANQDLNNFRKYFRKIIENYLRKKEGFTTKKNGE